jgi:hypothetical protein
MEKEEILEEWLRQTDQTYFTEAHKIVVLNAMEEYKNQEVKKETICQCCGKNYASVCNSCLSGIAQETGEQAYQSR